MKRVSLNYGRALLSSGWAATTLFAAISAMVTGPSLSAVGQVLFFDDFTGPTLSSSWQASLPTMKIAYPGSGSTQVTTYLGAPSPAFQSLGGSSVLRMSSTLNQHQRRGWSSTNIFAPGGFHYEARFNTLNQSTTTSIDAFIEIGIVDASNPARYDLLCPYGGEFSWARAFAAGSSIEDAYNGAGYAYQNDTWYRIVLEGAPGQNLRASLLSDSGTELIGFNLGHGPEAYQAGFRLVLAQAMGEPQPAGQWPVDVAVDYVQLTQVPEPGTAALVGCGLAAVRGCRRREQPASIADGE